MSATALFSDVQNLTVPFRDFANVMECPVTGEGLIPGLQEFCNTSHSRCYQVNDGIPNLFAPLEPEMVRHDVTEMVKASHKEMPFPNYDDINSRESLVRKARQNLLTAMLDEQLPDDAVILEAGCGTGTTYEFPGNVMAPSDIRRRPMSELAAARQCISQPLPDRQCRLRSDEPVSPTIS